MLQETVPRFWSVLLSDTLAAAGALPIFGSVSKIAPISFERDVISFCCERFSVILKRRRCFSGVSVSRRYLQYELIGYNVCNNIDQTKMFFVLIRCRVSKRNGVRPLLFLLERSKTSIAGALQPERSCGPRKLDRSRDGHAPAGGRTHTTLIRNAVRSAMPATCCVISNREPIRDDRAM